MFDEIDIKYTSTYQRMYGIGEIYDYVAKHLDVIRTHNKLFTAIRSNTIRLISEDIPKTILQKGNDIDILDAINILSPKLYMVLAKMGTEQKTS
jgi:ethanolamine utilization cobalamin adenosyltransferase